VRTGVEITRTWEFDLEGVGIPFLEALFEPEYWSPLIAKESDIFEILSRSKDRKEMRLELEQGGKKVFDSVLIKRQNNWLSEEVFAGTNFGLKFNYKIIDQPKTSTQLLEVVCKFSISGWFTGWRANRKEVLYKKMMEIKVTKIKDSIKKGRFSQYLQNLQVAV
jgi:hypothetical protein